MTVSDLKRILAQCNPESLVFVRLDDEALDNTRGLVFEIVGHDYSYGCTESLALMLECGQPDDSEDEPDGNHHVAPIGRVVDPTNGASTADKSSADANISGLASSAEEGE